MSKISGLVKFQVFPDDLVSDAKHMRWDNICEIRPQLVSHFSFFSKGEDFECFFNKARTSFSVRKGKIYGYIGFSRINLDSYAGRIGKGVFKDAKCVKDIEDILFELIREASHLTSINLNLRYKGSNYPYDGSLVIEKFMISDDEDEVDIDMLETKNILKCETSKGIRGISTDATKDEFFNKKEIYMHAHFLKVDERFIPIVFCRDMSLGNESLPEKFRWTTLKTKDYEGFLFRKHELVEMFRQQVFQRRYPKSYHEFHENLGEWLISEIDNAVTIEDSVNNQMSSMMKVVSPDGKHISYHEFESVDGLYHLLNEFYDTAADITVARQIHPGAV